MSSNNICCNQTAKSPDNVSNKERYPSPSFVGATVMEDDEDSSFKSPTSVWCKDQLGAPKLREILHVYNDFSGYLCAHPELSMWLVEDHINNMVYWCTVKLEFSSNTLYLAVNIFHRYFSAMKGIPAANLTIICFTCIKLAASFEEGGQFGYFQFMNYFFSRIPVENAEVVIKDMVSCEQQILSILRFQIEPCKQEPLLNTIIQQILMKFGITRINREEFMLMGAICERILIDYRSLAVSSTLLALGTINTVLKLSNNSHLNSEAWNDTLKMFNITTAQVEEVTFLLRFVFMVDTVSIAKDFAAEFMGEVDAFGIPELAEKLQKEIDSFPERDQMYLVYLPFILEYGAEHCPEVMLATPTPAPPSHVHVVSPVATLRKHVTVQQHVMSDEEQRLVVTRKCMRLMQLKYPKLHQYLVTLPFAV